MTIANGDAVTIKGLQERLASLEEEVVQMREQLETLEMQAAIGRGKEEAEKGLVIPARELVAALRAKFNLPTP
jgi:TolA-binding protein